MGRPVRRWQDRHSSARHHPDVWVDGIDLRQARMEPQAECMSSPTGATPCRARRQPIPSSPNGHLREQLKAGRNCSSIEGARPAALNIGKSPYPALRRARVLESPQGGVPDDASSALLAAQDIDVLDKFPKSMTTQTLRTCVRVLLSPGTVLRRKRR